MDGRCAGRGLVPPAAEAPWLGRRSDHRHRDRIARAFEVGRVDDFQVGDDKGKDALDAHVHAAAVACRADILLTTNVADFVWYENESPYEVLTPDEFLVLVDEAAPELVAEVAVKMCSYWFKRSGDANLPKKLKDAGCPKFAERVRRHLLANAGKLQH